MAEPERRAAVTASVTRRGRGRRRLTPEQVVELRGRLGLPPDGPTPEMMKAWGAEEGIPDSEEPEPAPDPPPPAEAAPPVIEEQLRAEIRTVREAFDILLDDRDQLARRLTSQQAAGDRMRGEQDRVAARLAVVERERDELRARLAEASLRIADMQLDVARVLALADELAAAAAEPDSHRHAWEWQPGLRPLPLPCACGEPWPRGRTPGGG